VRRLLRLVTYMRRGNVEKDLDVTWSDRQSSIDNIGLVWFADVRKNQ
jgi:hypothetical protein